MKQMLEIYIMPQKEKNLLDTLKMVKNKTKIFWISGEFGTFSRAYHACLLVKNV
jgi:hypothetical protein